MAFDFANESLNYRVMFKWGLVNKQAGHVTLSLQNHGSNYRTQLTAASERWADRFYRVRDTLNGVMTRGDLQPIFYEKIAREGSEHKHDIVKFSTQGATVTGKCIRKKFNKKGELTLDESRTLQARGTVVDMLTSFYYMRSLPFNQWKPGHVITVNIFSGKRKELLTIKYLGTEALKFNGKQYNTYHVKFTFTGNDGKTSSDPMEAWLSTDSRRTPLRLEGKLKVGKVQCFYTGSH